MRRCTASAQSLAVGWALGAIVALTLVVPVQAADRYYVGPNNVSSNVYVVDQNNRRIQKFTASGSYLTQWGSYGTGNGQFDHPFGVATDAAGNGSWSDPANWSDSPGGPGGAGVPAQDDNVYVRCNGSICVNDGLSRTVAYDYAGPPATYNRLWVDNRSGGTDRITLAANTLRAFTEYVGNNGRGAFDQSGGSHLVTGQMTIGVDYGSTGAYSLSGGDLTSNLLYVAVDGNAVFNQTAGSVTVNGTLGVGNDHGTGVYNLSGGTLSVGFGGGGGGGGLETLGGGCGTCNGTLGMGNDGTLTGGAGHGIFSISAGTLNADTVILGSAAGGTGDMTISGSGHVVVGGGLSTNDLIVNGGSLQVLDQAPPPGEDPVLGRSIVAGYLRDGAMTMNGGAETTPNLKIGVTAGFVGTLTMNGGTLTASNLLAAEGAGSVLSFSGGTITTGHSDVDPDGTSALVVGDRSRAARLNLSPAGGTHVFADGLTISRNGQLTGAGTITGNVVSRGLIAPGGSAGKITITGNFSGSDPGSVLAIEVGGTAPGT